ncbi:hypothetical protein [uncultured Mailhella sp.]|uniref:hypothetical protein n=1 Tax=uncultured Mailhella sp. TaxID=1981031 RepID=UPI0025EA8112|nr:hypothetical protein [uncultured Mailhella sp.]
MFKLLQNGWGGRQNFCRCAALAIIYAKNVPSIDFPKFSGKKKKKGGEIFEWMPTFLAKVGTVLPCLLLSVILPEPSGRCNGKNLRLCR